MTSAFIYAAGRALRLGAAFAERPKILIQFGGKTLLEWHVQRLSETGVRRLVVVTGYKHELVGAAMVALRQRYGVEIQEIVNPDFTEGSVLSFAVSLPEVLKAEPPVLLLDGDVLYPGEMLRRLVQSKHPSALLLDRNYSTDDDDPVLVPVRQGRPIDFMKKWKGTSDFVGESVGFFKVSAAELPLLVGETQKRTTGQLRRESYDDVLRALVLAGRFGHEDITGIPWTEIDFPEDVQFAEKEVLPAIQSGRWSIGERENP
ncbi:MAG: phosphocholine cytidylyltransferase family protein [Verrucomicrobia bacterium]|nr:phosphocholine cytidylyltransferase family protein [Verrucomicrobiota bacterium]